MTLFELWYIGMILVVILQQITIMYLFRKVEKYGKDNLLHNFDNRTYTCNDRNYL